MEKIKSFERGKFYRCLHDTIPSVDLLVKDADIIFKKGVSYLADGPHTLCLDQRFRYKFKEDEIANTFEENTNLNNGPDSTEKNDPINPNHYKAYSVEVIDMMERIYGPEVVAAHCECCAFKYRMRAGMKDDVEEQYKKEAWYLAKAKELRNKL